MHQLQEIIWSTKKLNKSKTLNQALDKLFCACDYFLQMSVSSLLKNQCRKLKLDLDKIKINILQSPQRSPKSKSGGCTKYPLQP